MLRISVPYMVSRRPSERPADARRAKPTAADKAAAERLRRLWETAPKKSRPRQEEIGGQFEPQISQGAISQYIHGKIPLNFIAVLIFAKALGCDTASIRDDLTEFRLLREAGWRSLRGSGQIQPLAPVKTIRAARWPFPAKLKKQFDDLDDAQKKRIQGVLEDAVALATPVHKPPIEKSGRG